MDEGTGSVTIDGVLLIKRLKPSFPQAGDTTDDQARQDSPRTVVHIISYVTVASSFHIVVQLSLDPLAIPRAELSCFSISGSNRHHD
jgi:hypothetical protein